MSTPTIIEKTAVLTQQRLIITGQHKPFTLETITEPLPQPAAGEVRLQVQAAGLAFADTEQKHGDDRGRGQRDLLGGLGGEVGPCQAVEGGGQAGRLGGGHGGGFLAGSVGRYGCSRRPADPPASRQPGSEPT